VPLTAVVRASEGNGQFAVLVVERDNGADVARMRRVDLGEVMGNTIAVRNGLHAGERVVVSGATLLVDGTAASIRGVLTGLGPQGRLLEQAPHAGIGFVEAHGLALILAVVLWRAAPSRASHLTALAMELLLGTANLAFWQMFVATAALMVGYVSTTLHWIFVVAQTTAALTPRPYFFSNNARKTMGYWSPGGQP
jgi:hypothetical protein